MRTFVPTEADRRRALGLLAVGIGIVLILLFFPFLKPWYHVERQRWELRSRISEAQAVLKKAAAIDAEFAQRREHLLASGHYLPEPSLALASAGLTQRLQQAATEAATDDSVCVIGNRVPIEVDRSPMTCQEVRVRASAQCGGVALQRFLQAIEASPPRLRIDQMTLALAPNPLGFDKPMTANQPVNVSFEVVGCLFPTALMAGDGQAGR